MHVVARQVAVVYGLHQGVHVEYNSNYGQQAAMVVVHVLVIDVITIKAQAADLIIKNQLLQHQVAHIECVQVECTDV
jgi:hypothetical protein